MDVMQEAFSRRYRSARGSLQRFQSIAESLGAAYTSYPSVHVAGTNGKGSVSLKIAQALEFSGLKVGLFTSPHLESFRERIVINGVQIPHNTADEQMQELLKFKELSFFELTTLLAFDYFKQEKVDIAIFEVGIGGLKDSTNLLTPKVSVITSIAQDHGNLLGKGLNEIAFQKAGIIKMGVPVVLGPTCHFPAIEAQIKRCASPAQYIPFQPGFYDLENRAIAKGALRVLQSDFGLKDLDIERGIQMRPSCRFEQHGRCIFDVAHNPAGIERLIEAVEYHFPGKKWSVVIGMSKDKDIRTCLKLLMSKASHLYLVPSPSLKRASLEEMGERLKDLHCSHFLTCASVTQGVKQSLEDSENLVVICGSFYIMKEAREAVFGV
jgi:dihydrofolate synthase/folylpolyglutamate synthase